MPGHFLFDGGADGAAITSIGYGFAGERINDPDAPTGPGIPFPLVELTSGGLEITITHPPGDPLTLIGTRTDGKEVFRIHVTDATTGAYSFTQSAPIDHPDHNESGAADPLRMKITFTVTDGDGDTASSSNQIDILDDAPVTTGAIVSPTTLDDDVFGGNSGGDNDGPDATTATGGPGALFDAGADGVKNVTLDSASGFKAIYVDANGVGHQESVQHTATVAADGTTTWTFFSEHIANVATLTIGADGSYNFTTHAPLVHPNGSVIEEYLPLTFDYTVTDGDNDAASGSLTINVNDDTPTLTQIYRYNNVYESQLTGGSIDNSTHFAVSFGADGYGAGKFTGAIKLDIGPGLAGNISFNVAGGEHTSSQFTSDGRPVTFRLVDDHTILGYVTSANNGDQGDVNVIELRLSSDNTNVTTTLFQPVDHIAAEDGSPISTLVVDASVIFTDGDNDPVGGIIRTTIHDDTPTLDVGPAAQPDNLNLALDETVQPDNATNDPTFDHFNGAETESGGGAANGGADDVGGPLYNHTPVYDLNPNANQAIGSLTTAAGAIASQFYVSATFGADGPGANSGLSQTLSLQLSSAIAATNLMATDTGDTHVAGLSDAARVIVLYQVSDTVIEGRIAGADGVFDGNGTDEYTAFRITLNNASDPSTAAITVDQFMAIDHGGTEDPSVYDENTILHLVNGTLNLKLDVTATDGDLDSVQKSVSLNLVDGNGSFISFDDDGPQVLAVTPTIGPNLVQNGSFENGHADIGASDWSIYSSLGDASLAGVWTWGPDHIPFEVQTGGSGGLGPKDGNALIELDGDTEGNPVHTPQGIPDPVVTNATIQQVIAGTEAGQTYELSFWYAPRPGDGANSSGMQVFFEGNLVYDIPASPNPPAGWQLITLQVTATGPNAVLAFTGTGGENEFGALLDNVNLHAVTILDDEDTTLNPAVEIQGGPGDDGHGVTATGKIEFDASTDGLHSIELHGIDGLQAIYVDANGVGHPESVSYNWVADGSGGGTLTGFTADLPTVFTMTVDASGNYTFHLVAPLDHPLTDDSSTATVETSFEDNLNLGFGFTITDGDGDTANGTIAINIDDDSPEAESASVCVVLDEPAPTAGVEVVGPQTFDFTGVTTPTKSVHQDNVTFAVNEGMDRGQAFGTEITITADAGKSFSLTNFEIGLNGSYATPHVTLTATDVNGVTETLVIDVGFVGSIGLSLPTTFDPTGTVFDPAGHPGSSFDPLQIKTLTINRDITSADRVIIDNFHINETEPGLITNPVEATADLSTLALFGADGEHLDGGFALKTFTEQAFGTLTADGEQVFVRSDGNMLTGYTADNAHVFTLTIDAHNAVFTLNTGLDQGQAGQVALDFGGFITATDGDGDQISLDASAVEFKVHDSTPPLIAGQDIAGVVEEEQLGHLTNPAYPSSGVGNEDTGSADSNDHDTGTTPPGSDVTTNATTGTLNVTGGLGPYTFQFSSSVDGHQAVFTDGSSVTSGGQPVLYSIQGDTLIGYVNSGAAGYTAGTDHAVFTIVLDSATSTDGTDGYTFTLYDHLDHNGTQNSQFGDNVEGTLSLNLSGFVTVTDSSGINAPVTLNGVIDVIDDTPIAVDGTVNGETVHEDSLTGLSTGNPDAGGNATTATIHASDLASLVSFGADSPGTVTLTQSLSGAVRTTDGTTLLSKNVEVHYAQDGSDIIGVAEDAGGTREVFRLHDNGDGTFTFALEDQVDHIPNDPADDDTQTLAINLASAFTATDSDGDSVQLTQGTLAVTVEDDIPYFGTTTDATVTQLHTLVGGTFDFHIGADEPASFTVTPPAINGVDAVVSSPDQNGVITVTGTFHDTGSPYYVLTVNPNGTYSFELDGLPTTTTTLANVGLNDAFGPTSQRDYGSFTLASDQNVNGSTQGVGVGSNGMGDGEHVTVQFDNPLSVANLGINFNGSGNITLSWKAIDSTTGHYETGTGTFSADGILTIDILNHVQGADADPLSSDISHFDKVEISGTGDNSAHARISSVGGTEITENHNPGPFDFVLKATDYDGDQAQTTLSIDTAINGLPAAIDASLVVDEDNLDSPPADFAGTQDLPAASTGDDNPSNITGHIADFGGDGPGGVSFAALNGLTVTDTSSTAVKSGGDTLHYFWDSATNTLYGSTVTTDETTAADTASFKIEINQSSGDYTFTLLNHVDHASGDNENNVDIDIPFIVSDSTPDTANGTIHVSIDDDMPVANPDSAETTEGAKPTLNAILVLDLSLSMGPQGGDPDGPGGFTTRLALMQAAVENFLSNSNVTFNQITIYSFGIGAELVGQFTIGENNYIQNAIDIVNGFDSGDLSAGTQYDSAANLVDGRTGSADRYANLSHPAADETNIYFLSDGDPQSGNDLNTNERADWSNFLSDSNINQVYALGFSNGASTTFLSQIAPRPGEVAEAVTDPTELSATLTGALPSSVSGNVLTDAPGVDSFGADGGYIQSITINGVTHDYAPGDATHITGTDKDGGKLTFYFADDSDGHHAGDYSYTAPASVTGNQTEIFHYVLVDGDGDTAEADLTITVHDTVPMVANDDTVLTNIVDGSDIVILSSAMLFNDIAGTGSGQLDITSVQDPTGGTVQLGSAIFTPFSAAPQTLIDANFNSGTEGFIYQDDVFRNTNESSHADGDRDDDALRVRLGGSSRDQGPMSGGWHEAFLLAAATTVTIAFDYKLDLSNATDNGENGQVLMAVDGVLHGASGHDYVDQLLGSNSGSSNGTTSTGTQHFEVTLNLGAGSHTIDLGAYMTGENRSDETTTAYFDNVSVVAAGHPFVSGSYNYTATDGHTNDDAHVIIVAQNGNTITGTDANEILVADGHHVEINAAVHSGSTFNADDDQGFSFDYTAGTPGVSITQIQIDVSGIGRFDQDDSNSRDFDLGSNSDVTPASVTSGDTTVLTLNFNTGDFNVGDQLRFAIDTDDGTHSLENGGDFGDQGVPFKITLSDGTILNGVYQSDGNASHATVTTDFGSMLLGEGGDDYLVGSNGGDTLVGGLGADILQGGAGADHFLYNAPAEGLDHILDFNGSEGDTVDILAAAFGLTAGSDTAGIFDSSGDANFTSSTERFHFDTTSHTLYYDADGNSGSASVALATFDNDATIQAHNIHLV